MSDSALALAITPRTADLGDGFEVRRALPSARRRMIGPFVFLDEMGPNVLAPGKGLDVRPHPHIGLATVTYLFEGELLHRDSLGTVQVIRPGDLNWMTAGRGIVHSERTPPSLRASGSRIAGIQAWVALPSRDEEVEPSFVHYGATDLPVVDQAGARLRVMIGEWQGVRSPVRTLSETLYADIALEPNARIVIAARYEQRGAYISEGSVTLGGEKFDAGRLLVFTAGVSVDLTAQSQRTRLLVLGGEAIDGPRHVWWNFVSSSRERIEQAKTDWKAGRFGQVPGETEFIPLPESKPPPVQYP